jgi:hypothetical protein
MELVITVIDGRCLRLRAGADRDRHAILDRRGSHSRDRRLLRPLLTRFHRRPRFLAPLVARHRAAVNLAQLILCVEGIEVATDGHLGHVEIGGQVGHPDRTGGVQDTQDQAASLVGKHRRGHPSRARPGLILAPFPGKTNNNKHSNP